MRADAFDKAYTSAEIHAKLCALASVNLERTRLMNEIDRLHDPTASQRVKLT